MQDNMPTPPTRTDWKPAHVPRLSYRNSANIEPSQMVSQAPAVPKSTTVSEIPKSADRQQAKISSSGNTTVTSVNALRPSSSRGNDRSPTGSKTVLSPTTQKKKSLFGGIFVTKEPTQLALERLAAQLEAQHGELSARAIPGVSSSKLPEHVPKVNSKWDGVPEALKEREKLQREKARAAKRQSLAQSVRSRSAEGSHPANARPSDHHPLGERNSNSTLSSFDSRGRAGRQRQSEFSSSEEVRPPSLNADAAGVPNKALSTKSQSLRSPSGSSLPHITSFFPNDIADPPTVPKRFKGEHSIDTANSQQTTSTGRIQHDTTALAVDTVPEHSSSPVGTPVEISPVTPSPIGQSRTSSEPSMVPIPQKTEEALFVSSGADVLGPPATATVKRKVNPPRHAFLAGEARPFELPHDVRGPEFVKPDLPIRSPLRDMKAPELPSHVRVQQDLEKRPDSSRERLGLRASMLVTADQAPWEWQDPETNTDLERSTSPRSSTPVVPKSLSKVLGKANK